MGLFNGRGLIGGLVKRLAMGKIYEYYDLFFSKVGLTAGRKTEIKVVVAMVINFLAEQLCNFTVVCIPDDLLTSINTALAGMIIMSIGARIERAQKKAAEAEKIVKDLPKEFAPPMPQ